MAWTPARPPALSWLRAGMAWAVPQVPPVSVTTSAWPCPAASTYVPPAPQLPGVEQEIEDRLELVPACRAPMPGTGCALAQAPPDWVTVNGWLWPVPSKYHPAAAQLPAAGQATDETPALPLTFSAAVPGTSWALPRVPPARATVNAC